VQLAALHQFLELVERHRCRQRVRRIGHCEQPRGAAAAVLLEVGDQLGSKVTQTSPLPSKLPT
jgi:hypothetical protein